MKFIRENWISIALYISLFLFIGIGFLSITRYLGLTYNFLTPTLFISGSVAIGILNYFYVTKIYKKEQKIQDLFQRVLNRPYFSRYDIIAYSDDEYITPNYEEYSYIPPQLVEIPSNLSQTSSFNYAGVDDGLQLFSLFSIFAGILRVFPSVERFFSRENRINYVKELEDISLEEQYALFKSILARNTSGEIINQLDKIIKEFQTEVTDARFLKILQKLEYIMELANSMPNRELLADIMLLAILIKSTKKGN